MIGAGEYRHVITFQEKIKGTDDYGGDSFSWADVATVRAKLLPKKGREIVAADTEQSRTTVRFYIRYMDGFDTAMRIMYKGNPYDIDAILDAAGLGRELEIVAFTGTSEG